MKKSVFTIPGMDCPSEEQLLRMKLEGRSDIHQLVFDLEGRQLSVFHEGKTNALLSDIHGLGLGGELTNDHEVDQVEENSVSDQRQVLWLVLAINFSFFLIEMATGIVSRSMGLVADSLDMLADSVVYALSLMAAGNSVIRKKKIARMAGYFQILLALIGFTEVVRRFIADEPIPEFLTMILVSVLALGANAICLILLQRSAGRDEVHMKASMIFTSNDVIINVGVIIAGALVMVLKSSWPDLLVGSIVFLLVIRGALRILKLGK